MEYVIYGALSVLSFIAGFFIKSYFPSYFNEKGKNLATKEDIKQITAQSESVKLEYNSELEKTKNTLQNSLEELKSELSQHSHLIAKKREVYDEMVKSLGIFFETEDSKDKKSKFLDDYARFWLWASDDVIKAFNIYIDINIALAGNDKSIIAEKTVEPFNNLLFELRKDAGHKNTKIARDSFRRMKF